MHEAYLQVVVDFLQTLIFQVLQSQLDVNRGTEE